LKESPLNRPRVVAVVQARCASERLPKKVLAPIAGVRVVEHVLRAVGAAERVDDVILATSVSPSNDELVSVVEDLGYRVFRGSEDDVLGRFVAALEGDDAEVVIRHTADDPLLDPAVIDTVVDAFLEGDADYTSNILQRSWPRGLDTEVFSRSTLHRADTETSDISDREHVTLWVRRHPDRYTLRNVEAPAAETWPELRLCIDTAQDKELLEAVFDALYEPGRILPIGEVVAWLRANPDVALLNAEVRQRKVFGKEY
jgi:spore coat polysaccharide biosynthesis protein SpsF